MSDDPKSKEAARRVVLARRARFVAAAVAGLGVACGKASQNPEPCLSPPPFVPSDAAAPEPCLSVPQPEPPDASDANTANNANKPAAVPDAGAAKPDAGARRAPDAGTTPPPPPRPCLSPPMPCLKVARPPDRGDK